MFSTLSAQDIWPGFDIEDVNGFQRARDHVIDRSLAETLLFKISALCSKHGNFYFYYHKIAAGETRPRGREIKVYNFLSESHKLHC